MAVTTESPQQNPQQRPQQNPRQYDKADDLAASAAEGMLGPNPFVGLRPCDIVATAQQIGAQALRQPALVMEPRHRRRPVR
jgi:polyhydroxyalkanoate synthase subunit PhaC